MDKYLKTKVDGQPRVYTVDSMPAFVELTCWLYSNPAVLFRGQTTGSSWPLVPIVGRNTSRSKCMRHEVAILEAFKREAIPYLDVVPESDWQWLAVARHNGLPTRLLDWSTNPLVALWFAVKDPPKRSEPGLLWAFSYDEESAVYSTKSAGSPFCVTAPTVYFPEHISPLIRAQSGAFTVHQKVLAPDRFPTFEESVRNADLMLTKIEVPPSSFPTLRFQLLRLGISPSSLLPGLRGVAERIYYENVLSDDEPDDPWVISKSPHP